MNDPFFRAEGNMIVEKADSGQIVLLHQEIPEETTKFSTKRYEPSELKVGDVVRKEKFTYDLILIKSGKRIMIKSDQ